MTNDSKAEAVEFPAGRNIGCCSIAAATWGRQHTPICQNLQPAVTGRGVEWTVKS